MRFIFSVLVAITFISGHLYGSGPISVVDALKGGKIRLGTVEAHGLQQNNVSVVVQNLTSLPINLLFGSGLLISPNDEHFQPLLHVDSVVMAMGARSVSTIRLTGYCTRPSLMGPRTKAEYRHFSFADDGLFQLAKLMFEQKINNSRQSLIWAYVDRAETITLPDWDEESKAKIKLFFNQYLPQTRLEYVAMPVFVPPHIVSIASNFAFMNEERLNLSLKLYSIEGRYIKSVFENGIYEPGAHVIKFGFNDFYPEGTKFIAKLEMDNGETFKESIIDEFTPYQNMDVHQLSYNYRFTVRKLISNAVITVFGPNKEKITTIKKYETLLPAYHNLNFSFYHYFDPKDKFTVELRDSEGKLYDSTEFDVLKKTKKLYAEWE